MTRIYSPVPFLYYSCVLFVKGIYMKLRRNVSLAKLTTLKTGGSAGYFTEVKTKSALREAVLAAKKNHLSFFVLGGGSNVLFRDSGFAGLVIKMGLKGVRFEKEKSGKSLAVAAAGEDWDRFVAKAVSKGFQGLENLSGIPGTVGASPIQNIGAYGAEVKDFIFWVEVFDTEKGKFSHLKNKECLFGYRDSVFKKPAGRNYIVTEVAYSLRRGGKPNLKYKDLSEYFSGRISSRPSVGAVRRAVLKIRRKKMPDMKKFGTAGSFFKNPVISASRFKALKRRYKGLPGFAEGCRVKISLAWIIDKVLGLNGFCLGKAELYRKQPLIIVNLGGAKAREITALAAEVKRKILKSTGVRVEYEVNVL